MLKRGLLRKAVTKLILYHSVTLSVWAATIFKTENQMYSTPYSAYTRTNKNNTAAFMEHVGTWAHA